VQSARVYTHSEDLCLGFAGRHPGFAMDKNGDIPLRSSGATSIQPRRGLRQVP